MDIKKLTPYTKKPALFSAGTSGMWTDPYISQQLLRFHIDPNNDLASRKDQNIDLSIEWILSKTESEEMNILDLGCGPGLYSEKFAKLGHLVTGVDFSQNSIDYAKNITKENGSGINYYCENYLNIDYENQFDLVILIYLDFCALKPNEKTIILNNINRALKKGGKFIFDVVNSKNIESKVLKTSWEVCDNKGFWKNDPYISLNNGYHYPEDHILVNQHIIVDQNDNIETYLFWTTYYDPKDLIPILRQANFTNISFHENILPGDDIWNGENIAFYIAEKL